MTHDIKIFKFDNLMKIIWNIYIAIKFNVRMLAPRVLNSLESN